MCRYSFNSYKPHYVCFDCRKTFKRPVLSDIIMSNGDWDAYRKAYTRFRSAEAVRFRNENPKLIDRFEKQYRNKTYKCPDCGLEMSNIGLDFKAPKKDKINEWKIVRSMYKLGNTFHTCGCNGPGYIPQNSKEYLIHLKKVREEYRQRLTDRNHGYTEPELTAYINYWDSKLQLINLEIAEYFHI